MNLNDHIQKMNEIVRSMTHPELKDAWASLREALNDIRDHNNALLERVRSLENELIDKRKYVFRDGKYWEASGTDKTPFCKRCMEDEKKPFHLSKWDDGHICDKCGWYCDHDGEGRDGPPASIG
jgi:hypothetical protein